MDLVGGCFVEIEQAKVVKSFVANVTDVRGSGRLQGDLESWSNGCGGHWSVRGFGDRWVLRRNGGGSRHGGRGGSRGGGKEAKRRREGGSGGVLVGSDMTVRGGVLPRTVVARRRSRRDGGERRVRSNAFCRGNPENGKPEFPEYIVFAAS